jgi:hypothetical protein
MYGTAVSGIIGGLRQAPDWKFSGAQIKSARGLQVCPLRRANQLRWVTHPGDAGVWNFGHLPIYKNGWTALLSGVHVVAASEAETSE